MALVGTDVIHGLLAAPKVLALARNTKIMVINWCKEMWYERFKYDRRICGILFLPENLVSA